jgi:3-hydroxyacyl-[acyl-carrier-protein] dehydratase
MDIHSILRYLPHRYPFLLVDRVLECTPGESIVALKNVTFNEPFFPGHFPQRPVMPGVLIVEAMAQAAALLGFATAKRAPLENEVFYFVGIDNARFKRPVEPGDQLILKATLLKSKANLWRYSGVAEVDGQMAAKADMMCAPRIVES